jgi:hypothetical protein
MISLNKGVAFLRIARSLKETCQGIGWDDDGQRCENCPVRDL